MSTHHYGDHHAGSGRGGNSSGVLVLPPTSAAAAAAAAAAAFNYGAMAHFAGLSLENFNNHMQQQSGNNASMEASQQSLQHLNHLLHQQTQHQFDLSSSVDDSVLAAAATTLINQLSPQEPTYVNL